MEKPTIPINQNNWIVFDLYDDDAAQFITGAVTADFIVDLYRNGVDVDPDGLYIHEIGSGRYHISNSADSSTPYRSTSEEQIHISCRHTASGVWKIFDFWAFDLMGRIESLLAEYIESAVSTGGAMTGFYDSRSDLATRLTTVRADIAKARKAQVAATGLGMSVTRGQLAALYEEEKWLLKQIYAIDSQSAGGFSNRAKFERPT